MQPYTCLALPFGYQFLAGAIAGVSEILVMYPLDGKTDKMDMDKKIMYLLA